MKDDIATEGDFSVGINSGWGFFNHSVSRDELMNVIVRTINFNPRAEWQNAGQRRSADFEAIIAIAITLKRKRRA